MDSDSLNKSKDSLLEELLPSENGRKKILAALVVPTKVKLGVLSTPIQAFQVLEKGVNAPEEWDKQEFEGSCQIRIPLKVEGLGERFSRAAEYVQRTSQSLVSEWLQQAIEERPTLVTSGELSVENLDAVLVDLLFMNARVYASLHREERFWKHCEFETRVELLRAGYFGTYKGSAIRLSRAIPADRIYGCTKLGIVHLDVDPVLEQKGEDLYLEVKIGLQVYWDPEGTLKKLTLTA